MSTKHNLEISFGLFLFQQTAAYITIITVKMPDSSLFRVKLLLGKYFNDHKSKAYVVINRRWQSTRQLHLHIKTIFGIENFLLTTADGIYLPGKYSY